MREILFRGKTEQGEWVYGVPVETVTNSYKFCIEIIKRIEYETEFECSTNITGESVYSNTVGQFTGLTDKNGNKVFEGDIVGYVNSNNELAIGGIVKYGYFNCSCCDGVYGWYIEGGDIRLFAKPNDFYEVIGNIHDNKELINLDNIENK